MSDGDQWETLDVAALLGKHESVGGATTMANTGSYAVPLGQPLRRAPVVSPSSDDFLSDVPEHYREMLGLTKRRKK